MQTSKTFVITLTTMMAFSFAGCGGAPDTTPCVAERPAWTEALGSDDQFLYGVGSARAAGGPDIAWPKAVFAARSDLGLRLEAQVTTLMDRLAEDLLMGADGGKAKDYVRLVQRQYSSQVLRGSEPTKRWTDPCSDYTWARVRIARAGLDGLLIESAKRNIEVLSLSEERLNRAMELLEREEGRRTAE